MKNHLLRGKTKKQKKQLFERMRGNLEKACFLLKDGFSAKPTFTSQTDGFGLVCLRKTIFLRGKSWVLAPKPSFYEEKVGKSWLFYEKPSFCDVNPKTIFFKIPPPFSQKDDFLVFGFASSKMVFHRKTNFCLVKGWFWLGLPNHLFAR